MSIDAPFGSAAGFPSPSYYLKIEDIPGDAIHKKHPDEIKALSFSWGASQSAQPKSVRSGKPSVAIQNLYVTAPTSSASPLLFGACATGRTIKNAKLVWTKDVKGDSLAILTLTLTDVVVSTYELKGPDTSHPIDTFSLSFGKVDFSCHAQKPDGSLGDLQAMSWDLRTNVG